MRRRPWDHSQPGLVQARPRPGEASFQSILQFIDNLIQLVRLAGSFQRLVHVETRRPADGILASNLRGRCAKLLGMPISARTLKVSPQFSDTLLFSPSRGSLLRDAGLKPAQYMMRSIRERLQA